MGHTGPSGQRRLTPGDIRGITFQAVRFGGISAAEVHAFQLDVARELDARLAEITRLTAEMDDLRSAVTSHGERILVAAQRTADGTITSARIQGGQIVEAARHQFDVIVQDAVTERNGIVQEGVAERDRVITVAGEEAGRQVAKILAAAPVHPNQLAYLLTVIRGAVGALEPLEKQVTRWVADDAADGRAAPPGHLAAGE
jgi:cell division septum initiation protein DivIVA